MALFGRKRTKSANGNDKRIDDYNVRDDDGLAAVDIEFSGRGPHDSQGLKAPKDYVDLGALYVPRIPGMQLRAQVDAKNKRVVNRIVLVIGASGITISVAAAPKSGGAWEELREQILQGLTEQGAHTKEVSGPYGIEIHADVPVNLPNGSKATSPLNIIGVEGARWLARIDLHGQAVSDARARKACEAVIDQLIVNRGSEPRARLEVLSLKLPAGVAKEENSQDEA